MRHHLAQQERERGSSKLPDREFVPRTSSIGARMKAFALWIPNLAVCIDALRSAVRPEVYEMQGASQAEPAADG